MYIKGASRRSVDFWTKHLQNLEENIRAEIIEKRGVISDDLRDMMLEMREDARLTRCKNFMYIASFNPCPHEVLTEKQWDEAFRIFELERGIPEGQARIVIEHEKEGRIHRHVVWNRIDLENCRAFDDGLNPEVCGRAEQRIEKELGLTVTATLKKAKLETAQSYKSYEMFRGMKSGIDPRDITAEITGIFRECANGADFVEGLHQHGYQLVQGRRAFCVLDPGGHEHSLARRIEGVNTKELRAFMQGVDLSGIPSVEEAKRAFREHKIEQLEAERDTIRAEIEWEEGLARVAIEKEKAERRYADREHEERIANERKGWVEGGRKENDAREPQEREQRAREQADNRVRAEQKRSARARIALAFALARDGQEFADAFEERGFILARVTQTDAERMNKWERRRLQELDELAAELQGEDNSKAHAKPNKGRGNVRTDAWFAQTGGFEALNEQLRDKAEASYEAWEHKGRHSLEDYVDYVQKREAERRAAGVQSEKPYERYQPGELVVIDQRSNVYQLNSRNTGEKKEDIEARLAGIDEDELLSVAAGQSAMSKAQSRRLQEKEEERRQAWLDKQPLSKTAGEIRLAYRLTWSGQGFQSAIEDRGFILAQVSDDDAERLNRWEQRRLNEKGRPDLFESYRAGELVAVNQYGDVHRLTRQNTGDDEIAREARLKDIDRASLLSVSAAQTVMSQARSQRQHEPAAMRDQQRNDRIAANNEKYWPAGPPRPEEIRNSPFHHFYFAAREATSEKAGPGRPRNLAGTLEHIWEAWQGSHRADDFAASLQREGIHLAQVTPEEAQRSHMNAAFAREVGGFLPRYAAGEIVAVVEPGITYGEDGKLQEPRVYRLDPRTTGDREIRIDGFLKSLDRNQLQGLEATKALARANAEDRITEMQAFRDFLREVKWDEKRRRSQQTGKDPSPSRGSIVGAIGEAVRVGGIATTAIGDMIETGLSTAGFVFNLIDPQKTPAQLRQEAINAEMQREKQGEEQIDWSNYTAVRAKQRENLEAYRAQRERQWELDRDR